MEKRREKRIKEKESESTNKDLKEKLSKIKLKRSSSRDSSEVSSAKIFSISPNVSAPILTEQQPEIVSSNEIVKTETKQEEKETVASAITGIETKTSNLVSTLKTEKKVVIKNDESKLEKGNR